MTETKEEQVFPCCKKKFFTTEGVKFGYCPFCGKKTVGVLIK